MRRKLAIKFYHQVKRQKLRQVNNYQSLLIKDNDEIRNKKKFIKFDYTKIQEKRKKNIKDKNKVNNINIAINKNETKKETKIKKFTKKEIKKENFEDSKGEINKEINKEIKKKD